MDRLEELTRRHRGAADPVIVVSGPPRSGTSLLMQMLEAGGVEPLRDDTRPADAGNPRGYYEFEAVKRLRHDHEWLQGAEGKLVKIVTPLLSMLPLRTGSPTSIARRRWEPLNKGHHDLHF